VYQCLFETFISSAATDDVVDYHALNIGQLTKAFVTNPTATGRFLVAGGFTGLPLIFPHRTGAVQN
jgi:hypothetical protein